MQRQPWLPRTRWEITLPTTHERITWQNNYSQDVGFADFMPLLLDIVQGTAYVVSALAGCLSYNQYTEYRVIGDRPRFQSIC